MPAPFCSWTVFLFTSFPTPWLSLLDVSLSPFLPFSFSNTHSTCPALQDCDPAFFDYLLTLDCSQIVSCVPLALISYPAFFLCLLFVLLAFCMLLFYNFLFFKHQNVRSRIVAVRAPYVA